MRVDFDVAMEVAAHEALVRQTYKDSVGVLTWCVGMTNATGHRVERYIGKPAPLQHCMNLYAWALTSYARQVQDVFKAKPLTQAQFAAALSFHWNTGAIKRATWVRYWLRGDVEQARKAFMNWITPKEIAGRRAKERDLFFDGKWSNDGTMTEFTRVRANMSPDWSSGRRINVAAELRKAFADEPDVVIDQQPEPEVIPSGPTLSPEGGEPVVYRDSSVRDIQTDLPITSEDDTMLGHNGGPPLNPAPTPIEQASKAAGAAKGAAKGSAVAGALVTLIMAFGWLPEEMNTAEVGAAIGIVVTALAATVQATIDAYRAPPNAG